MVSATINVEEFSKAVADYKLNFNLDISKVIREQTRLLIGEVINELPPKKKNEGVNAIRKDISKQFVDEKWLASHMSLKDPKLLKRIQGYLKDGNYDAIKVIAKDTGIFGQLRVEPFSESEIKRTSRGRIYQSGTKILPLDRKPLMEYRKKLEDHVGTLKASLKKFFIQLGGRLPAWISSKEDHGYILDQSNLKDTPFIEVGSLLSFAGEVNSRFNVTQRAVDIRTKAIENSIEKDVLNKTQQKFYGKI